MALKQTVVYPCYKQEDSERKAFFSALREVGFAGVEFWFPDDTFRLLVAEAKEEGLPTISFIGHFTLEDGLNNPDNHDRIEAELRDSIDMAAELDIPNLILFSGNVREGQSDEDARETTAVGIRRVASYAEEKNIGLNLELLNSKINHPGYQCDHTEWGIDVISRVNSPKVKVLYDIYHMQVMEGDLITTIQDNVANIGHFHTAGVPGRLDIDDEQEIHFPGVCKAIVATGYTGYIGHEFTPKGDSLAGLKQAYARCNTEA